VLKSLTRRGKSELKVAAVLRPCEMRAAIELAKLGQVDLKNLITITMDCPGALSLSDFSKDPAGELAKFDRIELGKGSEDVRPICRICTEFSMTGGDLHLGTLDGGSTVPLITNSDKGEKVLATMGLAVSEDVGAWKEKVHRARELRQHHREAWRKSFGPQMKGTENLLKTLSSCINCHNCMRVCPVCYCRICVFDSERLQHKAEDYLDQAKRKGSLRFPPDMLLFHMGRMSHIALTCVSCGACEDACPASIPIAQMFSLVAEDAQTAFGYLPGRDKVEPLPLTVYREEELEGDKND
jgi:formate dehydrogenase subunit beta